MMIEARHKRTGETKSFTEKAWALVSGGAQSQRSWEFVRRYSVEVPQEIQGWLEAADKAGKEDLAVIEQGGDPEINIQNPQNINTGGVLRFVAPKQKGKKRRSKTPE